MASERNAMAELAKELSDFQKYLHEEFKVGSLGLEKAQRIVAELAKVRSWFIETANKQFNDGKVGCHQFKTRCYIAFKNCRAIAEEGAGDETME